ncbi:MAG: hypothetical protein R3E32_11435 [Chitinophagales bacterium]
MTVIENANAEPSISGELEYCASDNTTTLDAGTWSSYKWSNGETSQVIEASEVLTPSPLPTPMIAQAQMK